MCDGVRVALQPLVTGKLVPAVQEIVTDEDL
jgi:hypothetical protein